MPVFVVHGAESSNGKRAALVTAASASAALVAARALGVSTDHYATATQVQAGDLATPDVAFYGDAIGARGNGTWPDRERGA